MKYFKNIIMASLVIANIGFSLENSDGKISRTIVYGDNNSSTCDGVERKDVAIIEFEDGLKFYFKKNTDNGKAVLSTALTAHSTGKTVKIYHSGGPQADCSNSYRLDQIQLRND